MTTDIVRFDQFVAAAPARIEAARTTDEVQQVLTEAKVLAAAARAAKNKEYEEMAKSIEAKALNRLGRMMAAQRDAGMMKRGGKGLRGNDYPAMTDAGIDKNLAKAARKAYPEGWSPKPPKARPMTTEEKIASGRSPGTDRWVLENGVDVSRVKMQGDEIRALRARIAELEEENARLKSDLEALQTGQIMQMSRVAMEQRRRLVAKAKANREARMETETMPDVRTVEDYERQIKRLKNQINIAKVKAMAVEVQTGALKTFSNADIKSMLALTHPDRATDPGEKAKLERAFKLINSIPRLVET